MSNWIKYTTTLEGHLVKLIPMEEGHLPILDILAKDERIWEHYPFDGTDSVRYTQIFNTALIERDRGTQFPFAIFHKIDNKIIGSTRYLDLVPQHRKLEIGSTWLHPDYWATATNLECKMLLLTYAFENLEAIRVQLRTDENNIRSRRAIEIINLL